MYLGASALYIYQEGRSHVQCSFYRYMYTKGQIKLVFYFSSDCQQAGIKMILMKSNLWPTVCCYMYCVFSCSHTRYCTVVVLPCLNAPRHCTYIHVYTIASSPGHSQFFNASSGHSQFFNVEELGVAWGQGYIYNVHVLQNCKNILVHQRLCSIKTLESSMNVYASLLLQIGYDQSHLICRNHAYGLGITHTQN